MNTKILISFLKFTFLAIVSVFTLSSCGSSPSVDTKSKMIVSVKDQTMLLTKNGKAVKAYKVSTSKFGVGNTRNSKKTPLGKMVIAKKIGGGSRSGTVFKSRKKTGEILKPNKRGRDPIVTRIMWLKGKEYRNSNTYRRFIYIHGTPAEHKIGRPASFGCIRMKSKDVIDLYSRVGVGAEVKVVYGGLNRTKEGRKSARLLRKTELVHYDEA